MGGLQGRGLENAQWSCCGSRGQGPWLRWWASEVPLLVWPQSIKPYCLSPEIGTGRNCSPGDHRQSQSEQLPHKEQAPVVPCGDERRCGAVRAAAQAGATGSTLPCPAVPRGRSLLLSLCEKEGAQNMTESHFPQFCYSKPRHFEKSFPRADHHTAFCS